MVGPGGPLGAVNLLRAAVVHDAEAQHLGDLERIVGVEGADGVEAAEQVVVEVELTSGYMG